MLLDEINLASPETLECIAGLLQGPSASVTLTEQGSLEPVPRHPEFRLFACMNPATDVGKKDLPSNIRAEFTEFEVPPPDEDSEALISVITHYIGHLAITDKAVISDIAELYTGVKELAASGKLADGSKQTTLQHAVIVENVDVCCGYCSELRVASCAVGRIYYGLYNGS